MVVATEVVLTEVVPTVEVVEADVAPPAEIKSGAEVAVSGIDALSTTSTQ